MNYRVWYSTKNFADYIVNNTSLKNTNPSRRKLCESDANNPKNFHTMPDHIKKILYLDAPDIIVEMDSEPIFSIELSTEAGSGHNVFQRFARIAASVENNVPAFYIYPEAAIINRKDVPTKWDKINPLIFKVLDDVMSIYKIPALLYYFPSDLRTHAKPLDSPNLSRKGLKFEAPDSSCPDSTDQEMQKLFTAIDEIIKVIREYGVIAGREKLISNRMFMDKKNFMQAEYARLKIGEKKMSPLSTTIKIPTSYLLNYLSCHQNSDYKIGELLRSRDETIIYKVDASFRGDPYPGALAAVDYLTCREGKSFEERKYNLVLAWGKLSTDNKSKTLYWDTGSHKSSIDDFIKGVHAGEKRNILTKTYSSLSPAEIPRYYMQVRYGSTFSKVKHIRVFSYFADAILFPDGALWRDA